MRKMVFQVIGVVIPAVSILLLVYECYMERRMRIK